MDPTSSDSFEHIDMDFEEWEASMGLQPQNHEAQDATSTLQHVEQVEYEQPLAPTPFDPRATYNGNYMAVERNHTAFGDDLTAFDGTNTTIGDTDTAFTDFTDANAPLDTASSLSSNNYTLIDGSVPDPSMMTWDPFGIQDARTNDGLQYPPPPAYATQWTPVSNATNLENTDIFAAPDPSAGNIGLESVPENANFVPAQVEDPHPDVKVPKTPQKPVNTASDSARSTSRSSASKSLVKGATHVREQASLGSPTPARAVNDATGSSTTRKDRIRRKYINNALPSNFPPEEHSVRPPALPSLSLSAAGYVPTPKATNLGGKRKSQAVAHESAVKRMKMESVQGRIDLFKRGHGCRPSEQATASISEALHNLATPEQAMMFRGRTSPQVMVLPIYVPREEDDFALVDGVLMNDIRRTMLLCIQHPPQPTPSSNTDTALFDGIQVDKYNAIHKKFMHQQDYLQATSAIVLVVETVKHIHQAGMMVVDLEPIDPRTAEQAANNDLGDRVIHRPCGMEVDRSLTCMARLSAIANVLKNNKAIAFDVLTQTSNHFMGLLYSPYEFADKRMRN